MPIDVVGSGAGIRLGGGYRIRDGQVVVIVVVGHVVGLGVGNQVGDVLEGRLSINDVFGEGIGDRSGLGNRFGTVIGSGIGVNSLGSIVELVDGINGGLWVGTVMLCSRIGFDRIRKDVDRKGNELGVSVVWPGNGTSA